MFVAPPLSSDDATVRCTGDNCACECTGEGCGADCTGANCGPLALCDLTATGLLDVLADMAAEGIPAASISITASVSTMLAAAAAAALF